MTSDERRFYVRGALAACAQFKSSDDVVGTVCRELGLTAEDMEKFMAEEREAAVIATRLDKVARKKPMPIDLGFGGARETR